MIIQVYHWFAMGVAKIWNAIATAINTVLGWAGIHLEKIEVADIEKIEPVSPEKGTRGETYRGMDRGVTYNIIVRTEAIIDEEAETRTASRIAARIDRLKDGGR